MSEIKHIWLSDDYASVLNVTPPEPDEMRYTLTEGEEWDEIWSAAQTHFRSLSEHREELLSYVVEAFIAYFEEPRDE